MRAKQLLERAAYVVESRRSTYGPLIELFEHATRWALVIGVRVTPAQAMLCPAELKLAPIPHNPRHLDSIIDIARYAGCLGRRSAMRELRSHLGRHRPERIDPEAEKRTGWRRHGILVVAEQHPCISWPEPELVRQPSARLYDRQQDGGR